MDRKNTLKERKKETIIDRKGARARTHTHTHIYIYIYIYIYMRERERERVSKWEMVINVSTCKAITTTQFQPTHFTPSASLLFHKITYSSV